MTVALCHQSGRMKLHILKQAIPHRELQREEKMNIQIATKMGGWFFHTLILRLISSLLETSWRLAQWDEGRGMWIPWSPREASPM